MSSLGGFCSLGNFSLQPSDRLHGLVDREGGLRQPHHLVGVAHLDVLDVVGPVHQRDVLGRLPGGADDLLVALVADEEDVVVVVREADRLAVHLGHERAGGVDRLETERLGLLVHDRCHAVGGEDDGGALGHLVGLLDEHRTALLQRGDDVLVVHDLLAHVDGRPVQLEGLLDRHHGPVDAGAVPTRGGQQDTFGRRSHASIVGGASGTPESASPGMPRARPTVEPRRLRCRPRPPCP